MTYQVSFKNSKTGTIVVINDEVYPVFIEKLETAGLYDAYMAEVNYFAGITPTVAQGNGQNGHGETETIEVESIEFMGKNRWVVKGGWAKQFGITVWPEVLEEAGLLEHLKIDEENVPHKQWIATYTKKPKKEGDGMTADKVIKLELSE